MNFQGEDTTCSLIIKWHIIMNLINMNKIILLDIFTLGTTFTKLSKFSKRHPSTENPSLN